MSSCHLEDKDNLFFNLERIPLKRNAFLKTRELFTDAYRFIAEIERG